MAINELEPSTNLFHSPGPRVLLSPRFQRVLTDPKAAENLANQYRATVPPDPSLHPLLDPAFRACITDPETADELIAEERESVERGATAA